MEAELGVTQLQVEECQGPPAAQTLKERHGADPPQKPLGEHGPVDTLIVGSWSPEP